MVGRKGSRSGLETNLSLDSSRTLPIEGAAVRKSVPPAHRQFLNFQGLGVFAGLLLLAGSLSTAALAQGPDNGIETESEAWERLDQGDLPIGAEPLRQLIDESELVVLGSAATSVPTRDGSESVTDLRLDLVLKGRETAQHLKVVHLTPRGGDEAAFAPGDLLLAFLHRRGDGAYEPVDATFGMKAPGADALAAYRERIESFLGLPRDAGMNPADLAEWLVATTEEPLTRKAGASELLSCLDALAEMGRARKAPETQVAGDLRSFIASRLAAGRALDTEPIPALVGAFLTGEQKVRLETALESTRTLDRADLTLYEIVKTWDREEALPGSSGSCAMWSPRLRPTPRRISGSRSWTRSPGSSRARTSKGWSRPLKIG